MAPNGGPNFGPNKGQEWQWKSRPHKRRNDPGFTRDGQATETHDASTFHSTNPTDSQRQPLSSLSWSLLWRARRLAGDRPAIRGTGDVRRAPGGAALAGAQHTLHTPFWNGAQYDPREPSSDARRPRVHGGGRQQFRAPDARRAASPGERAARRQDARPRRPQCFKGTQDEPRGRRSLSGGTARSGARPCVLPTEFSVRQS